jgi:hypothetical protein
VAGGVRVRDAESVVVFERIGQGDIHLCVSTNVRHSSRDALYANTDLL